MRVSPSITPSTSPRAGVQRRLSRRTHRCRPFHWLVALVLVVVVIILGTSTSRVLHRLNQRSVESYPRTIDGLVQAAADGNLEAVRWIVAAGVDVNSQASEKENQQTALGAAADGKHPDVLRFLIGAGADVDKRNTQEATPLMLAAFSGCFPCVQPLLDAGADVNATGQWHVTPLVYAASYGHAPILELLVKRGAAVEARYGKLGSTALLVAAAVGHTDVVAALLRLGADANARDNDNETPLLKAAGSGHTEITRLLTKHRGVDVNERGGNSKATPLLYAAEKGKDGVVEVLLSHGANATVSLPGGDTALFIAARQGYHRIVGLLLGKPGIDVNYQMIDGQGALHVAASGGHTDVVRILVSKGANVHAKTEFGATAVFLAASLCRASVVKLLVQHGASPAVPTNDGWTPFLVACKAGCLELVNFLVTMKNGVDFSDRDPEQQRSPIALAAANSHDQLVRRLFELHPADLDTADRESLTPLHIAAINGNVPTIRALLKAGANETRGGGANEWTPLIFAVERKRFAAMRTLVNQHAASEPVVNRVAGPARTTATLMAAKHADVSFIRFLMNHGGDPNVADAGGSTALHVAAAAGHVLVIHHLAIHGSVLDKSRGSDGFTPLHVAVDAGRIQAVRALLSRGSAINVRSNNGQTPIFCASNKGFSDIVALLLDAHQVHSAIDPSKMLGVRADVDVATEDGDTALGAATSGGCAICVQLLVSHGASVNTALKSTSATPLMRAVDKGYDDIVALLLKHTKDDYSHMLLSQDTAGETVVYKAAKHHAADLLKVFLADPRASSEVIAKSLDIATHENGWTPLHAATDAGSMGGVRLLVDLGADVARLTKDGESPLCIATSKGFYRVMQILLSTKTKTSAAISAMVNQRCDSGNGETPLMAAARRACFGCINELLEHGADKHAVTKDGRTAASIAKEQGRYDIAQVVSE